jgi:hypothetical protein
VNQTTTSGQDTYNANDLGSIALEVIGRVCNPWDGLLLLDYRAIIILGRITYNCRILIGNTKSKPVKLKREHQEVID